MNHGSAGTELQRGTESNGGLHSKLHKKHNGPKTAQQCLESIKHMFAFDWTLKDVANLKHNPCKLISPYHLPPDLQRMS